METQLRWACARRSCCVRSTARAAFTALRDRGLLVREMHSYGIANGLRISIGLEPHMRGVVEVLMEFGALGAAD